MRTKDRPPLLAASMSLAQFEDLTAEAAIELRRGKVRDRGTALVQLINPDLFRVEVRGPLFHAHFYGPAQRRQPGPCTAGAWIGP